jgi:hypothetical protein
MAVVTYPGFDTDFARVQRAIETGSHAAARELIRALARKRLSRGEKLRLAISARVCDLQTLALKLLQPVVYPPGSRAKVEDDWAERVEYASSLGELGAGAEALRVISRVDLARHPGAARNYAFAHFRVWDWLSPLPRLEQLLARRDLGPKDRWQGRLLLATVWLHGTGDYAAADAELRELSGAQWLGGPERMNVHQLHAQSLLFQEKWREAADALDRAEAALQGPGQSYRTIVLRQWRAFLEASAGDRASGLRELRAARAAFEAGGYWENARSAAFYETTLTRERELLLKLVFGTPYEGFHSKVRTRIAGVSFPETYDWSLAPGKGPVLDSRGGGALKPGHVPQRALAALSLDFHRPLSVGDLHEALYPGEHFNPASSPARVRQALQRLRNWLRARRSPVVPVIIDEKDGRYRLSSSAPAAIRVGRTEAQAPLLSPKHRALEGELAKFGEREFSAAEVGKALGLGRWSAVSWLREAVSAGIIERRGSGPATRYRRLKSR